MKRCRQYDLYHIAYIVKKTTIIKETNYVIVSMSLFKISFPGRYCDDLSFRYYMKDRQKFHIITKG